MSDWKRVYETAQEYRAHIVKAFLEDRGIRAMVINKQDRPYLLGFHEVHVPTEQLLGALHLINEYIDFE